MLSSQSSNWLLLTKSRTKSSKWTSGRNLRRQLSRLEDARFCHLYRAAGEVGRGSGREGVSRIAIRASAAPSSEPESPTSPRGRGGRPRHPATTQLKNCPTRLRESSSAKPGRVSAVILLLLLGSLLGSSLAFAQPPATIDAQPPATIDANRPRPTEEARKTYLGRIVAQYMSHLGASWLIRTNRDDEENVTDSYTQLRLTEGMTVCDMGCGNGFWTLPMAKDVGPSGKVLAVDIQPEMLDKLQTRAGKKKIKNIESVLGAVDDPNLPAGKVDLLLMVDVYHEFSHPESMLWGIRRALKPEGVVALLEYREEDPTVPIKPLHKMSKTQIMKEYQQNGFKLVREYNKLPWQHLMFFARDDSPLKEIVPVPATDVLDQLE
jgi:ubiquinone/menaquinone biosynthesis C-methylase UbiE